MSNNSCVKKHACSPSIPIIPIRYAVLPNQEKRLPEGVYHSYKESSYNLQEFPKIKHSHYTLRSLRAGYVYQYDETTGIIYLWEADEKGYYTELRYTSWQDYGNKSNIGERLKTITAKEKSKAIHLAFSPHLWTKKIVSKIQGDPKFRQSVMQRFEITELINGKKEASTQKHVMPVTELKNWVEDYKENPPNLAWSCHRRSGELVKASILEAIQKQYRYTAPKIPAVVVLFDATGICTDLDNISSLELHKYNDIKNDDTKTMDFNTNTVIKRSQEFYNKKVVADIITNILSQTHDKKGKELRHLIECAKEKFTFEGRKNPEKEAELHVLSNKKANANTEFIEHIDLEKLQAFQREWDKEQEKLEAFKKDILNSINDHAVWLRSGENQYKTDCMCLASEWSTYDRMHKGSAFALEASIIGSMTGFGLLLPGVSFLGPVFLDQRQVLLDKWLTDPKNQSPLHLAVAAFKPYADKKDSVADFLSGAAGVASTAADHIFPSTRETYTITTIVMTYTINKFPRRWRWQLTNSSATILAAAEEMNITGILDALSGRYDTPNARHAETRYSRVYNGLIADAITSPDSIGVSQPSRPNEPVRITQIAREATQNNPIENLRIILAKELAAGGVNGFVAFLHIMNLLGAIQNFDDQKKVHQMSNLLSALIGTTASLIQVVASGTIIASHTPGVRNIAIVGRAATSNFIQHLGASTLMKTLGYAGAAVEALTHAIEGFELNGKGDHDAANWSFAVAVALGVGGAVLTYAGGAAATAAIGTAAVTTAAVVAIGALFLVGFLLIGLGILFIYYREKNKDKPLDIWVSRTMFGKNRVGERFQTLAEALDSYFIESHRPVKITKTSKEQTKVLGYEGKTTWHENYMLADEVEFTFLLPGYQEGISEWKNESAITTYDEDDVENDEDSKTATKLGHYANEKYSNAKWDISTKKMAEGLLVNIKQKLFNSAAQSARITINYWPNKSVFPEPITGSFYIDD